MRCELDTRDYPKGIKVSDAKMMTLNIEGDTFDPLSMPEIRIEIPVAELYEGMTFPEDDAEGA